MKVRVDADTFALLFEGDAIESCVTEGRIEGRALHQVQHVDRVRRDDKEDDPAGEVEQMLDRVHGES